MKGKRERRLQEMMLKVRDAGCPYCNDPLPENDYRYRRQPREPYTSVVGYTIEHLDISRVVFWQARELFYGDLPHIEVVEEGIHELLLQMHMEVGTLEQAARHLRSLKSPSLLPGRTSDLISG